jgi:hypothetical protein
MQTAARRHEDCIAALLCKHEEDRHTSGVNINRKKEGLRCHATPLPITAAAIAMDRFCGAYDVAAVGAIILRGPPDVSIWVKAWKLRRCAAANSGTRAIFQKR